MRNERYSQPLAGSVEIGANQQRLPGAENVFREAVVNFALTPRHRAVLLDLQMKHDCVAFLERYIEIRRVKDLPEFLLHRAQHFILVKPRADRLADLCQKLIFLSPALRVVHDHVVFESQADLQSEANQQPQVGVPEQPAFGVGKENDAKVVLASLQADRSGVMNVLRQQRLSELLETAAWKCWEWLGHVAK